MSNAVAPGTVLVDKYRLVSLLGRGGMGEVWRAEHLGLRAPVAIKLMNPEIVSNSDALARFNREAQAAASLRSPHVVQILDHGLDPVLRAPFIAMELMDGESLATRLERAGRLSHAETARVITHISRALARAHEAGIVHRDLKPDNVFLVRNEDEEIAKVLDFGIAKASPHLLDPGSATRTGAVMGTPYYMSPEQISGAKGVDHRTDLWALGVIACQCLTGRLPFMADTIGGLVLAICTHPMPRPSLLGPTPLGFDRWFARALARDPAQRFQSARELAEDLRRVCSLETPAVAQALTPIGPSQPSGLEPTSALSVGAVSSSARLPKRGPSKAGWLIGGALALVACLALGFWLLGPARTGAPAANSSTAAAPAASAALVAAPAPTVEPSIEAVPSVASTASASAVVPSAVAAPQHAATVKVRPSLAPAHAPVPAAHSAAAPGAPAPTKTTPDDSSVFDRRKG